MFWFSILTVSYRLIEDLIQYLCSYCILQIEVLSAINGDICFTVSNANEDGPRLEDDAVVGLHLFAGQKLELTSRYCNIVVF